MAKTGERRKSDQPFGIDRLPAHVQMKISRMYANDGMTWAEIEKLSAEPVSAGGFIEWDKLSTEVLELFPQRRLPHSNLHRWYDVRRRQVTQDALQRSEQARVVAEAFSQSVVDGGDEAVLYAARDIVFSALSEDSSEGGRSRAAKVLVSLAKVMQARRTNDIRERKVAVEEKTLQIKLDLIKAKAAEILNTADGVPSAGAAPLTRDEVMQKVREIYGVA